MLPQSGLGEIIIISVYVASLELVNLKRKLPSVGSASLIPRPSPLPHFLPQSWPLSHPRYRAVSVALISKLIRS